MNNNCSYCFDDPTWYCQRVTSKTLDVDTGKVTKKIDCCVLECSLIEDRIKKAASKQVEEQAKEEFDKKCAEIDKHAKSMYADLEKKLITRVDMQDKKLASMQQYITTLSTQLVAKIAEEKASREAVQKGLQMTLDSLDKKIDLSITSMSKELQNMSSDFQTKLEEAKTTLANKIANVGVAASNQVKLLSSETDSKLQNLSEEVDKKDMSTKSELQEELKETSQELDHKIDKEIRQTIDKVYTKFDQVAQDMSGIRGSIDDMSKSIADIEKILPDIPTQVVQVEVANKEPVMVFATNRKMASPYDEQHVWPK